ncbi:hypothetical protein BSKO_12109 [Bryopsis sp. KO-2023]|nr:hypothetical protein BSKO_12109 [Bryopsis sp. KO-2023]
MPSCARNVALGRFAPIAGHRRKRATLRVLNANGAKSQEQDASRDSVRKMYVPDSGKKIVYGMFQEDVQVPRAPDGSEQTLDQYLEISKDARSELRKKAAEELVVIDQAERDRRVLLGSIGLGVALVVDIALVVNKAGFFPRLLSYFPLAFGLSFFAAGKAGMCQLAQGGMWDIDGTGFREIEDEDLAKRIQEKFRNFSIILPVVAVSLTLAFASIPLE